MQTNIARDRKKPQTTFKIIKQVIKYTKRLGVKLKDIHKLLTCKFDDEVPFMWPRETRPDLKRSEVGLGGVKFVHVVNDREIRISLKV